MGTIANIKIEPCTVTWGASVYQISTITFAADVAGSLNNKYFFFYDTTGAKNHLWFNINSAGSDPAPGGSTARVVTGATGATAGTLATAAAVVIDALTGFDAVASNGVVTITHTVAGYAQAPHDGNSSFSFAVSTIGDTAADLGFMEGDLDIEFAEDLEAIKSHQTGSDVITHLRKGTAIKSVSMTLEETSSAQLKRMIRAAGGSFTPTGVGGTEVTGWGSSKQFTSTILSAAKLVFHPVVLGATDYSRDHAFPLAYPMLEKLVLSGEKMLKVPLKFMCYRKETLNAVAKTYTYGDHTQTLT